MSAPGMFDRVMHAQIWKLDIADIAEDYNTVLLNFIASIRSIETMEIVVHTVLTQLNSIFEYYTSV